MPQILKINLIFAVYLFVKGLATEEGYTLPPVSSDVAENIQLIGPRLDQWTITDCFREKSFHLLVLIDTVCNSRNECDIQINKDFLVNIVDILNLESAANKVSILP